MSPKPIEDGLSQVKEGFILFFLILAVGSLWSAGCSRSPEITIAQDGRPVATIVIGRRSSEAERFAAGELQHYLQKISGAVLSIRSDIDSVSGPLILVGRTKFLEEIKDELDKASLREEDLLIRTAPGRLYLTGGGDWGTAYAVYTFLESLGVRWMMPGPLGEVIPRTATIALRGVNEIQRPAFKYRRIYSEADGEEGQLWALRNKANNFLSIHGLHGYQGFGGHSYASLVPPKLYWEEHPEYYALYEGERTPDQISFLNPNTFRILVENVRKQFDSHPDPKFVSAAVSPNDNPYLDEEGYLSEMTHTDRVVEFTNKVARAIAESHPDKLINFYVYADVFEPPVTQRHLESNVVTIVAAIDVDRCYSHNIDDLNCPWNVRSKRVIEDWMRLSSHVLFYDYWAGHYALFAPWAPVRVVANHVKFYARLRGPGGRKVEGLVPEMHVGWATQGVTAYAFAKLSWDPELDVNALLEDYYTKYYGPAAQPMESYFDLFTDALAKDHFSGGHREVLVYAITDSVMAAAQRYLAEAEKVGEESPYRERIELNIKGFRYLELKRSAKAAELAGDVSGAVAAAEKLIEYTDDLDPYVVSYLAKQDATRRLRMALDVRQNAISAFRKAGAEIPPEGPAPAKFISEWEVIGPFPSPDCEGFLKVYPPEEEFVTRDVYESADGAQVRWQHISTSYGLVDFKRIFGGQEYVVAYAAQVLASPGRQEAILAVGSDDGVRVWFNGELVLDRHVHRTASPFQDLVPVTLKSGDNRLLVKISQRRGRWGFYASLYALRGRPLKDLTMGLYK